MYMRKFLVKKALTSGKVDSSLRLSLSRVSVGYIIQLLPVKHINYLRGKELKFQEGKNQAHSNRPIWDMEVLGSQRIRARPLDKEVREGEDHRSILLSLLSSAPPVHQA